MQGAALACLVQAMTAAEIRRIDLEARAKFVYRSDPPGTNPWRSSADAVLASQAWTGECADLTSTVLDLMARAGEPLANLYRVAVSDRGRDQPDHMIGCTWDADEVCWVIGDTFGEAYPAKDCAHRALLYQRMDEISTWREGAPWACASEGTA